MATSASRALSRRLMTHLAVGAIGVVLGAVFSARSASVSSGFGHGFEREPFERATMFVYAWGSEAEASALLNRAIADVRSRTDAAPLMGYELSILEFRRAIVQRAPRSELLELCRAAKGCRPERLDSLIAKLAAARRVP